VARYSYVVLTRAAAGQEADFLRWYDERHLHDVQRVEGVISAKRFDLLEQKTTNLAAPPWHSLAIYEIESDDPQSVLSAISSVAGTEAMPISDALNKDGMVQLLVKLANPAG
jgi:epsilon-lactone hydrolase